MEEIRQQIYQNFVDRCIKNKQGYSMVEVEKEVEKEIEKEIRIRKLKNILK